MLRKCVFGSSILLSVICFVLIINACNNNELSVDPSNENIGKVEFSVGEIVKGLKKTNAAGTAASIIISAKDQEGNIIYDKEKIILYNINGSYISGPLSFKTGLEFNLTEFFVADSLNNIIYICPKENSPTANLVTNPLDLSFNILKDQTTKVVVEVVEAEGGTPEDFGYATFGFTIANTLKFFVQTVVYDTLQQNFIPTEAFITITNGSDTLRSQMLADTANAIYIKDHYASYNVEVTKTDYQGYSKIFTSEELKSYSNIPLAVMLEKNTLPATLNYWGDGSDGDLSTTGNVSLVASEDGDMVVKKYNNLTINAGHTFTTDKRCKGLVLYVLGDLLVEGTISMTARGAAADPVAAGVPESGLKIARVIEGQTESGNSVFTGAGSAIIAAEAKQISLASNGKIFIIPRQGENAVNISGVNARGVDGVSASFLPGSGGAGGRADGIQFVGGIGGKATCFSGGAGAGGANVDPAQANASNAGGKGGDGTGPAGSELGGGAGNPGGSGNHDPSIESNPLYLPWGVKGEDGTGGIVLIFVKGNITISSNGKIESNGSNGGGGRHGCGGGSGGGLIAMFHAGTYENNGIIQANGGLGSTDGANDPYMDSGNGGAGAVEINQISE